MPKFKSSFLFAVLILLPCDAVPQSQPNQPAQQPASPPLAQTVDLKLHELRTRIAFETLAKVAGLDIQFSPGFDSGQSETFVSLDLKGATLQQALDEAASQSGAFWRLLPAGGIMVTNTSGTPPLAAVASRMLVVGPPKVYDDLYLQNLLSTLRNQLSSVQGVDQATLLSHIGQAQGVDFRQTSVALSASGPPTAGTSNFALPAGVPAFSYPPGFAYPPNYQGGDATAAFPSGTATSTTPGTTTTVPSVTPSAPTPSAPILTPPSVGQSSLGAYNESLQLSYEIANTQLLLDGAISDRLQTDGRPKTTFTLGFPITIAAPHDKAVDKDLENAVAEVEVAICGASEVEPASLVTLLPRERSYNVASMVDQSFLGSISAVLGGVANVGGSFLWRHSKYYLVQQQETVALLHPGGACGQKKTAVDFSWQINPVLGKTFVRPGTTTDFVQISVPGVINDSSPSQQIGSACVTVRWRKGDKKGNYIGDVLSPVGPTCYPIHYYNTSRAPKQVTVTDIGQGTLHVGITGMFLPGSTVRLGSGFLSPSSVTATHDALTFDISAKALAATEHAFIVGRDGREMEIVQHQAHPPKSRLTLDCVDISPFSDSASKVKLRFSPPVEYGMSATEAEMKPMPCDGDTPPETSAASPSDPAYNPWVVIIGGKVFGLSDAPFFARGERWITLVVPTDLLRGAPGVELRRLLWPAVSYRAFKAIPANNFAKSAPSISKTSILSSQKGLTLAVLGSGLDDLMLVFPQCKNCCADSSGSTFARILIPKPPEDKNADKKKDAAAISAEPDPTDGLKQIVLCRGKALPYAADAKPTDPCATKRYDRCDANYPVLLVDVPKLDTPAAKPSLEKPDPVPFTDTTIKIKGTMLDQVVLIEDGKLPLHFVLSADKPPVLNVDLPPSIKGVPGGHALLVTFADKTTAAYLVTVQPKAN